jgi:uncharacterized protein YuzE
MRQSKRSLDGAAIVLIWLFAGMVMVTGCIEPEYVADVTAGATSKKAYSGGSGGHGGSRFSSAGGTTGTATISTGASPSTNATSAGGASAAKGGSTSASGTSPIAGQLTTAGTTGGPPPPAIAFFDDFESGLANWSGLAFGIVETTSRSATHCLTDTPSGNFVPNTNVSVTLAKPLDLSRYTKPTLSFWYTGCVADVNDHALVEVSTDGGSTWISIWDAKQWTSSTWYLVAFDLTKYKATGFRMRFHLTSNATVESDGIYIDDVTIREAETERGSLPFYDDLESGLDNWIVSGSGWGTTDTTSRSDSHALTDSPNGNFLSNTNAAAWLAKSLDLTKASKPTLSFWYRGDVSDVNDHALVETSTDGGLTWTVIWDAKQWNLATWSLLSLDLSPYKSTAFRLRFRLTSNGTVESSGWQVDDISIRDLETKRGSLPFFDDFESGLVNWTVSGYDWTTTTDLARSATHALTDSPTGNFLSNSNAAATLTTMLDTSKTNKPILSFWCRGAVTDVNDHALADVSTDGGVTWTTLWDAKQWTIANWYLVSLDLSNYKSSTFRARFRLTSSASAESDGIYLDDISIRDADTARGSLPFFDDFESGLSNWTVSGSDWDLSATQARSETHSLTDSPSGNFLSNAYASATLTKALDLSQTSKPTLSFFYRGEVSDVNDHAFVDVSTDGGIAWAAIWDAKQWLLTTWSLVSLDLSTYKSASFKLRLRLTSNASIESDGIFVDDVSIREAETDRFALPFFDDFESGIDGWIVSGSDWGLTTAMSRSSSNALTDSPAGNFLSNSNAAATLAKPIDLSKTSKPTLSFWFRGNIADVNDHALVEVSTDGGVTWTAIWDGKQWLYSTWLLMPFDLSTYKSASFKVRFRLTSNASSESDGWYLDDVSIREADTARGVLPFFDDLESGLGNWIVSGFDWNTVTTNARSGTHALTDSPTGNFLSSSNSRAILAKALDISQNSRPILSFWYRGDISDVNDHALLEVATDGGVNWTAIWDAKQWALNTWSLVSFDLSTYKSASFTARFKLSSNTSTETDGFYVDDISIREAETKGAALPFADDFESGLGNWTVSGSDWNTTTALARGGSSSLTDSPSGTFLANGNAAATLTKPLDLSTTSKPTLTFWYRGEVSDTNDHALADASTDGGVTWTNIWDTHGWTQSTWTLVTLDLSGRKSAIFALRFRLSSNATTQGDGFYVDDVAIQDQ